MDVIVVGAGIVGCAAADELSRRGRRVLVIDSRTPGAGATQASAGMLVPYIEAHERGPLFDLTLRSLALYDTFIAAVARDAGRSVEYRRTGSLEIADSADRAQAMKRAADTDSTGTLEWIPSAALRALEPSVADSTAGALLCRAHGYVAVPQLMDALQLSATRHGAQFLTAAVTSIRGDGHGFVVEAGGMTHQCDRVVLAAGSWTSQLDVAAEIPAIRPVRGQLLRLRWTGPAISHVLWGPDCYIVPWTDGTVLVGATAEDVGFDERATVAGVRDLLEAACELLPQAWSATFVEVRVGLRPAALDDLPVITASTAMPGLVFATGHYRNGILLAPLTAQMVAGLIEAADR